MYKLIKNTENILYKYSSWTQPVFTANNMNVNGVWYGLTCSQKSADSVDAWKAFDGSTASNNGWWTGNIDVTTSNPAWICLQCDHKLKLTSVKLKGDTKGPENPKQGVVQVSNNGTSWKDVGSFSFASNTAGLEVVCTLTPQEGYYFYRVYCTDEWADGVVFGEITYTGQIAKEVTSGNYDYSVSRTVCKTLKTDGVYKAYKGD